MASRGMSWMAAQTIAARALSLAGQLILGWLLVPEEFGLYALALSISGAVGAVRNGGVSQLLVRRTGEFDETTSVLGGFALIFNLAAAVLLALLAPLAAFHFHSQQLLGLLLCIAISFPAGTLAVIYRSRLMVDGRYRDLTTLNLTSTLFWQATTIGMALAGYGPYSYVIPTALQGPFETVVGYWLVNRLPAINFRSRGKTFGDTFMVIFRETRWVMLGAAMLSFATTGDYLAVGLFTSAALVGQYFFAFQLVSAVGTVISSGIETVLPPLLARLDLDTTKQNAAMLEMTETFMLLSWPLAGLVAFGCPPLLQLLWGSKWAPAATAIGVMAFCLPAWILKSSVRSLLEARGQWKLRFLFLGAYGLGGVLSAAAGAMSGSLDYIVYAVTGFYLLFAAGLTLVLAASTDVAWTSIVRRLLFMPIGVCVVSSGLAAMLASVLSPRFAAPFAVWVLPVTYFAVIVSLNATLLQMKWRTALSALLGRPAFVSKLC